MGLVVSVHRSVIIYSILQVWYDDFGASAGSFKSQSIFYFQRRLGATFNKNVAPSLRWKLFNVGQIHI